MEPVPTGLQPQTDARAEQNQRPQGPQREGETGTAPGNPGEQDLVCLPAEMLADKRGGLDATDQAAAIPEEKTREENDEKNNHGPKAAEERESEGIVSECNAVFKFD